MHLIVGWENVLYVVEDDFKIFAIAPSWDDDFAVYRVSQGGMLATPRLATCKTIAKAMEFVETKVGEAV